MTHRPKAIDLFCGAGGASMGLSDAGYAVTGVDTHPQEHYPFAFVRMDALEVSLGGFDLVWASPPCQSFTAYRRKGHGVGDGYPDLIETVRSRLRDTGVLYVIENVPGAPLEESFQLCGSSFGLDVRRHRIFETNFPVIPPGCNHEWQQPRFAPATNRTNLRSTVEVGVWRIPLAVQQRAMGIDWMALEELSQAIPPAYSRWIGLRAQEARRG